METTIRRLNDQIYTLGTGVIAFAAWTLLKFTLYCTVYQNALIQEMNVALPMDNKVLQVTIIAVWVIMFLDAMFQCLIGFSARADGKGKRKSVFYLVLIGLRLLYFVPAVFAEAKSFITVQTGSLYAVITLFIDGTSLVIMVELLVCAVRVRILRKRQREVPHES